MDKSEIISRLKKIGYHAIHINGESPFVMSLDDGIAVNEAINMLNEQEAVECINDHGVLLCGRCKNIIGYDDGYGRSYKSKFCCECGRSVK